MAVDLSSLICSLMIICIVAQEKEMLFYEKIMVFSTNLLTVLKYWHILLADLKSEC